MYCLFFKTSHSWISIVVGGSRPCIPCFSFIYIFFPSILCFNSSKTLQSGKLKKKVSDGPFAPKAFFKTTCFWKKWFWYQHLGVFPPFNRFYLCSLLFQESFACINFSSIFVSSVWLQVQLYSQECITSIGHVSPRLICHVDFR